MQQGPPLEWQYDLWRYHFEQPLPAPDYAAHLWLLLIGLLLALPVQWIAMIQRREREMATWSWQRFATTLLAGPLAAGLGWLVALERHVFPTPGTVALHMLVGAVLGWGLVEALIGRLPRRLRRRH